MADDLSPQDRADLDALDAPPDDRVMVVLAVHNGVVTDDGPMFVQILYAVPPAVILAVQQTLSPYLFGGAT